MSPEGAAATQCREPRERPGGAERLWEGQLRDGESGVGEGLTAAEPWSCALGHQGGSFCTPPPPFRWTAAGSGVCFAALAACPGCGLSVAGGRGEESVKTMVTETQKAHRTRQGPGRDQDVWGLCGRGEVQSHSPAHHCPAHRNESSWHTVGAHRGVLIELMPFLIEARNLDFYWKSPGFD